MTRVKKSEVMNALQYFHSTGYIENLYGDGRHFTEILMKFAAQKYNIELVGM